MLKLKFNQQSLFLVVILLAALALRVVDLANTPNGFHADEASFALNAKAILETGMDEDGRSFPISLNSYIDPKPALFSYLQIPFIAVIPDVIVAARLPSAILGVISIWLTHILLTKLSSKRVARIGSILMAISPWHIMVSRGTQEVILSFLFFVLFLIGLHRLILDSDDSDDLLSHVKYGSLTLLSAFLSAYVYHSAKIVIPLIAIVTIVFAIKNNLTNAAKGAVVSGLIILVIAGSFFIQESSSRLEAVNIFTEKGYEQQLTEQIYSASGKASLGVIRVFYNKAQTYSHALLENYLEYFSPDFLLFEGAKPTRYQIPNHGLLFLLELPLLFFGMYYSIKHKTKYGAIFWALLLIAPLPAAVTTQETPSMIRSFLLILPLIYFSSMGITQILKQKNQLVIFSMLLILTTAYLWSLGYFGMQYSIQAAQVEPWYRNSPYTKISESVSQVQSEYESVEVTNDLRPLYAYFVLADIIEIADLQAQPLARNEESYTFGNITFNKSACNFDTLLPNSLYIAEVGCRQKNDQFRILSVVETITYEDGTPAYELLEIAN